MSDLRTQAMEGAFNQMTREFCQRCQGLSAVGFMAPLWFEVAGRHWCNSILCIVCFAILGDEKGIAWEVGIEFYPVSYVTLNAGRQQ